MSGKLMLAAHSLRREREREGGRDNSEGVFFTAPPIIAHQVAYLCLSI